MNATDRDLVVPEVITLIPSLRGYARALTRNPVDADDLVQETLTKALASIDGFQPGTKLRAWLFTIMRNTFYNNSVKRRRENTGAEDCVSGEVSVAATQETTLLHNEVLRAINTLPENFREMLILVVMLGERYEDAAVICNCAVGTVKSRVNRARQMVIDLVGDDAEMPVSTAKHSNPPVRRSA
ncbi:sigma-70 family RNA polymerase sigma factor [Tabrizicola sp. BL-A-41-H6]|uniref:sigma-70 family RNA polymerase sigma factor n=1 Tax=Tabrizicola sp. BL-A-41-H6 TaxID=3421107 RepID=UPI003D67CE0A